MLPCRIVELFPAVPINPHWGIVSKCLTYSKAACDPFVYSLLRHQYKKTCTDIINRLLKRSSLNPSGVSQDNQVNSIPTMEWWPMCWAGGRGRGVADWRDTVWELTWQLSLNHKADLASVKKSTGLVVPLHVCLNPAWHALHKWETYKKHGQICAQQRQCACIPSAQSRRSVQWTRSECSK